MSRRIAICGVITLLALAAFGQPEQNTAKGFAADKTYEFGNLDHINLFNLNVNVLLPVGQVYQTGPSLSYRFMLTYSGNNWSPVTNIYHKTHPDGTPYDDYLTYSVPVGSTFPTDHWNAGMGWRLSFGSLIPYGAENSLWWTYLGPDGGRHNLSGTGPHVANAVSGPNTSPAYSNDGSYLRMDRVYDGATGTYFRDVSFPDGAIHRFRESDGSIVQMRDRFGNHVDIAYATMPDGSPKWTITDGYRTHVVEFMRITATQPNGAYDSSYYDVIKTIKLAAFNGSQANYVFRYGDSGNDLMTLISREIAGQTQDLNIGPAVYAPLLHSITLPTDQTTFTMTYNEGDGGTTYSNSLIAPASLSCTNGICTNTTAFSGHLAGMKLPTGGAIAWDYAKVMFPPESTQLGPPGPTGNGGPGAAKLSSAIGVSERRDLDVSGKRLSRRTYSSDYFKDGGGTATAHTLITTTQAFNGPFGTDGTGTGTLFSTSLSYYSVAPMDYAPRGTLRGRYGLPFTSFTGTDPDTRTPVVLTDPIPSGDTHPRYLSTKSYDASNHLLRYTYVGYDGDEPLMVDYDQSNRRQRSERTVFRDSNGGNDLAWSSSVSTDYDGLGHYRVTTTDGAGYLGDSRRVSTTYYNKADSSVGGSPITSGTYDPYASNPELNFTLPSTWILNTSTRQQEEAWVTKGTATTAQYQTAISLNCFDWTTGFLLRRRVLSGSVTAANDLISRYTPGSTSGTLGAVVQEDSFGGDTQTVSTNALCGLSLPTIPTYSVAHTYSSGSLATSKYLANASNPDAAKQTDPNFYSINQTIDGDTGAPSSSLDASDVMTTYNYDGMGRLTEVKPVTASNTPRAGWTTYTYTPLSGSTPPRVTIIRKATDGTALTQAKYEFDSIGRVLRELHLMPGNTWSAHETIYNGLGWKDQVSEAYTDGDTTKHYSTFANYDPFGRAGQLTAADGATTTFSYTGTNSMRRTVSIATGGASDTPVTTTENYDRYGHLVQVSEPSGPSTASSPVASNVVTNYAYDVGGRLTSVKMTGAESAGPVQLRSFEYDGRGFLLSETSPESGTLLYSDLIDQTKPSYDARGHAASRRTQGTTLLDLQYFYDAAERLTTVNGRNPGYDHNSTNRWTNTPFRTLKFFNFGTDNIGSNLTKGKVVFASRYNYLAGTGIARVDEYYLYRDDSGRRTDKNTIISYENDNGPLVQARQITQHTDYNDLDQPKTIGYPMCIDCGVPNIAVPERNLQPTYEAGRFKTLPGFVTDVSYWPSGMLHVLTHANNIADTQDADLNGMARPRSISFGTWQTCVPATIVVAPQSTTVSSGTAVTLSVTASGTNLQYQWYDYSGGSSTPIAGATFATYTTPALTATKQYFVRLTSDCKVVDTVPATITVTSCVAPAINSSPQDVTVRSGEGATLQATASGSNTLSYQWYRGSSGDTSTAVGTNSATYTTPALTTTTYYWVKVSNGCSNSSSSTATVHVAVAIPTNLVASVLSGTTTTIRVTWSGVSGMTYKVERLSQGSGFAVVATVTSGTSWDDTGRALGVTYVYRVKAVDSSSTESAYSNRDLATTTSFTAPVAQQTKISTSFFEDLRTAVNDVRAASGLAALSWSEIAPAGTAAPGSQQAVWAVYLSGARNKMDEALQNLGIAVSPYTDPDLTKSVKIKVQHMTELEARVQ